MNSVAGYSKSYTRTLLHRIRAERAKKALESSATDVTSEEMDTFPQVDEEESPPLTTDEKLDLILEQNHQIMLQNKEILERLQAMEDTNALRDKATTATLAQIKKLVQKPYMTKIKWPLKTVEEFQTVETRFVDDLEFRKEIEAKFTTTPNRDFQALFSSDIIGKYSQFGRTGLLKVETSALLTSVIRIWAATDGRSYKDMLRDFNLESGRIRNRMTTAKHRNNFGSKKVKNELE